MDNSFIFYLPPSSYNWLLQSPHPVFECEFLCVAGAFYNWAIDTLYIEVLEFDSLLGTFVDFRGPGGIAILYSFLTWEMEKKMGRKRYASSCWSPETPPPQFLSTDAYSVVSYCHTEYPHGQGSFTSSSLLQHPLDFVTSSSLGMQTTPLLPSLFALTLRAAPATSPLEIIQVENRQQTVTCQALPRTRSSPSPPVTALGLHWVCFCNSPSLSP